MPKVSILVPSFNLAPYIGETIKSVLSQTFTDFELIIEDDGSTDNSLEVIRPFLADERVALIVKAQNEGQNKTTNNLIEAAHGEYLCLLPADDVWEPEKLAKQVAYLDANPDCGIVFGHPRFMLDQGEPHKYPQAGIEDVPNLDRKMWRDKFRWGNCLFIATSMYRRSLHDELGKFSEELHLLADLEWYVRIVQKHDLHVIQEHLATIRLRKDQANLSASTPEKMEVHSDELEIIRARHYQVTGKSYMIATPFYEVKGYSPYIVSLVQTIHALTLAKVKFEYVEISGDSYVWRARNLLAERFMNSDYSHLIFLDSDQGWSLESFMRLLRAEADVVGGAYPSKNNWEHYSVVPYGTPDEKGNGVPESNDAGLIYAQKVPTGFMKIKREVFQKIKDANPDDWYWEHNSGSMRKMWNYFGHLTIDHVAYGEDISFCKRCEALGIELFCEPRCDISHIGVKTWVGNYSNFLRKQPGGDLEAA